jgi:cytochrome c
MKRDGFMGDLTLNKIFGSLLAVALMLFGLRALSDTVFADAGGEHNGDAHGEDLSYNDRLKQKYAYYVAVEGAGGAGGDEEEEVFDLGLALASADVSRGERSFKGKCATCHTIEQGGANGTGPNLHGVVGADVASHDGFSYSGALSGLDGEWDYAAMNEWLYNPSSYARGTSMAFAGLRRDDERANVIAYLASYAPDAPPFPEPAPQEPAEGEAEPASADEAGEAGDGVEASLPEAGLEAVDPMQATGEIEVQDFVEGAQGEVESIAGTVADEIDAGAGAAQEAGEAAGDIEQD